MRLIDGLPSALPGTSDFFGIPFNDHLLRLWDTVEDRLFKIQGIARWVHLVDSLSRLPDHPPNRLHELTPKSWRLARERADTQTHRGSRRSPDAAHRGIQLRKRRRWAFTDQEQVFYAFTDSKHGKLPNQLLVQFSGRLLLADGGSAFNEVVRARGLRRAGCSSHAARPVP